MRGLPDLEPGDVDELEKMIHDLRHNRHTFASRLVMAGVDLRTVQDLMGHKTIAMTVRYAHLSAAHELDAVERLNREPTGTTTGTEETTESVAERAIVQVSEKKSESEWRWVDSNHRPRDYEALALTT